MKERPILFSSPMIRAIRERRKTKTRRVITPQRTDDLGWLYHDRGRKVYAVRQGMRGLAMRALLAVCPYGGVGDRLWVRETWHVLPIDAFEKAFTSGKCATISADFTRAVFYAADAETGFPKRPSIFMPRWASRLTLEIVNVGVERVQDMSEADARAEGAQTVLAMHADGSDGPATYTDAFADLWDSINATRGYGWDVNPWVWVIEFKQVDV